MVRGRLPEKQSGALPRTPPGGMIPPGPPHEVFRFRPETATAVSTRISELPLSAKPASAGFRLSICLWGGRCLWDSLLELH